MSGDATGRLVIEKCVSSDACETLTDTIGLCCCLCQPEETEVMDEESSKQTIEVVGKQCRHVTSLAFTADCVHWLRQSVIKMAN